MPTPIAHGVAAWAAARTAEPNERVRPWLFALVAFLAVAPDLDFVPGVLAGRPSAFHRGPTHSVAGAVLAAAVIAWFLQTVSARRNGQARGWGAWFGLVMPMWCAHLVLDLVIQDTRGASGIPLFWPFSSGTVAMPIPLPHGIRAFIDLQIGSGTGSFLSAILSGHGLAVFMFEGLLFTPLLLAPRLIGNVRRRIDSLARVRIGGRAVPGPAGTGRETSTE